MHRFLTSLLAPLLLCTLLLPLGRPPQPAQAQEAAPTDRVESLLASMSLEQKIGQMFMVNVYGKELKENGIRFLQESTPGAVAIFGYNTNDESAETVAAFIEAMQATAVESGAGVPLFVAVDQEGGRVRRIINGVTYFPEPLPMGAVTQVAALEQYGAAMGAELSALGINMNLAPVADLYDREDATNIYRVMHRRTFGEDPEQVGWQAAAYSAGLAQQGVVGVLKHFPGHGGAADSHAELPVIRMDEAAARAYPLRAFEVAIAEGVPAIMVGHLYYSALEPEENLPATLSPTMISILRDELGFEGIIMTDAMDMSAVADHFYVPEAAVRAFQAGVDMFVAGPHLNWTVQQAAMQQVLLAVEAGDLSESRLDESVRRILRAKLEAGILDWTARDPGAVSERIDLEAGQAALLALYQNAATLVKDEAALLPLRAEDKLAFLFPMIYQQIYERCGSYAPDATFFGYNFSPADWEYGQVAVLARQHDKLVIFVEDTMINSGQAALLRLLPPERTVLVSLGLPYDLEAQPEVSTFMAIYGSLVTARLAACDALFAQHPVTGRLPVAVGDYPAGSGIDLAAGAVGH